MSGQSLRGFSHITSHVLMVLDPSTLVLVLLIQKVPITVGRVFHPKKILLRQGLDITPSGVDFTPTANILVVSQELGTNQLGIRRHVWKSEATRVMPL